MTTRAPREGEVEGVSYYFTDKETFKKRIEAGELLEHAEVYGNYYGTPKSYVEQQLAAGKDVILEIEIQGGMKVKEKEPDTVMIFIVPPSMEELENVRNGFLEKDFKTLKGDPYDF